MKTAVEAKVLTDNNVNNLVFISDLIEDATSNGFYSIMLEDSRMTDEISSILEITYGYTIKVQKFDNSDYYRYIIDWSVPVVV